MEREYTYDELLEMNEVLENRITDLEDELFEMQCMLDEMEYSRDDLAIENSHLDEYIMELNDRITELEGDI